MVSRDQHLDRMAASLQAWQRALAAAAAEGVVLEVDQAVGSIVPAAPSRSILNAVAGPRSMRWGTPALQEIGQAYDAAGVEIWGIWAHEDCCEGLQEAGLVLDSRPTAMALDLSELPVASEFDGVTVQRTRDLALLAGPLSSGYGFPTEMITGVLPRLLDHTRGWVAFVDGTPAAGLVTIECEGDAGVFMVASVPALRGRGAASSALRHALLEARELGCTGSTLQSSAMGHSLYRRLGYVDLGRYLLWERRSA